MKCELLLDMKTPEPGWPNDTKPAGTIIDNPDAFRLVQMGCAKPADEECEKAHGRSEQELELAKIAYGRVSKGIIPDDYEAFDAGIMTGYNPDGSWKPGPNYVEPEPEDEDEEPDDE